MKSRMTLMLALMISFLPGNRARAADASSSVELRIACAADLQTAMSELQQAFVKSHPGITLKVSVGASGTLTSQIEQQAPFDLFFSADSGYPSHLAREGLSQGEPFEYAEGKLVLWLSRSLKLSSDPEKVKLKILEDSAIHKVAIGNPDHAPYGRAAVAAMKNERVYDPIQTKLVKGENISQAAQFVQTGAADAGLISASLAMSSALKGRGIEIDVPASDYPALKQSAVILKSSTQKDAANQFKNFILSAEGRGILEKYGYSTGG